jgi:hypothetical protein
MTTCHRIDEPPEGGSHAQGPDSSGRTQPAALFVERAGKPVQITDG